MLSSAAERVCQHHPPTGSIESESVLREPLRTEDQPIEVELAHWSRERYGPRIVSSSHKSGSRTRYSPGISSTAHHSQEYRI